MKLRLLLLVALSAAALARAEDSPALRTLRASLDRFEKGVAGIAGGPAARAEAQLLLGQRRQAASDRARLGKLALLGAQVQAEVRRQVVGLNASVAARVEGVRANVSRQVAQLRTDLAQSVANLSGPASPCLYPWIALAPDLCLTLSLEPATFEQADIMCRQGGGTTAVFRTEAEFEKAVDLTMLTYYCPWVGIYWKEGELQNYAKMEKPFLKKFRNTHSDCIAACKHGMYNQKCTEKKLYFCTRYLSKP